MYAVNLQGIAPETGGVHLQRQSVLAVDLGARLHDARGHIQGAAPGAGPARRQPSQAKERLAVLPEALLEVLPEALPEALLEALLAAVLGPPHDAVVLNLQRIVLNLARFPKSANSMLLCKQAIKLHPRQVTRSTVRRLSARKRRPLQACQKPRKLIKFPSSSLRLRAKNKLFSKVMTCSLISLLHPRNSLESRPLAPLLL